MRRTVTLRIGRIPQDVSRPEVIRMLAERFGTWKLLAVQFLPGFRVQLTFDSVEAKNTIERQSEVEIEGYPCQVVGGGPSLESVLIFHLPYELDNGVIQAAMQQYGEVGGIRHQLHPDSTVHSGTRVVRMVRKGPIPRHMKVEGWSAKVWYRGQPVECDICGAGHVSRYVPCGISVVSVGRRGILPATALVATVRVGVRSWLRERLTPQLVVRKVGLLT